MSALFTCVLVLLVPPPSVPAGELLVRQPAAAVSAGSAPVHTRRVSDRERPKDREARTERENSVSEWNNSPRSSVNVQAPTHARNISASGGRTHARKPSEIARELQKEKEKEKEKEVQRVLTVSMAPVAPLDALGHRPHTAETGQCSAILTFCLFYWTHR